MIRYQTWSITGWSWQISFDRYSNDRSTIMVTALPRIIRALQGVQFLDFWEHLYISNRCRRISSSVFCPRDEVPARCGRRLDVFDWGHGGASAASILDPVKKAHNTQNLLCHYLQTLSKRFSICCDWLGVGHNRGFYATRSISVCFCSVVDCSWTNHFKSTSKTHLQTGVRIHLQNWVNWF